MNNCSEQIDIRVVMSRRTISTKLTKNRKNSENREQSKACFMNAEVHPVFAGTAKPCSVSLHKNPPLRNVLGYGIANLVDNQPLMLFASKGFSGLEQTGVFPLFRLNPERMDGVNAGFIYELAHKKRMQTQHQRRSLAEQRGFYCFC